MKTILFLVSVTVPDNARNHFAPSMPLGRTVERIIENNIPLPVATFCAGVSTTGPQAVTVRASQLENIKEWTT